MHPHRNRTWGEAHGLPETSARLDGLPAGLAFPEDFPEPIQFDDRRKRLVYRGFMCSTSYAYLRHLSTDRTYLTALDTIFSSTSETLRPARRGRMWAWVLAAAGCVLAAGAVWQALR
jgi:hypothetical protein